MLVVTGCSGAATRPGVSAPPLASAAPVLTAPSPQSSQVSSVDKVEEQVLSVYRKFWVEALPAAYAAKRAERRAILEPVMVDPALSDWLVSMVRLDRAGQKRVGQAVLLTQDVTRRGNVAVVKGCLDTYNVGKMEVKTHRFVSRGVRRDAVRVWLLRSDDGAWRVSVTMLPKDPRC